ncbi:sodium/glutamate symporter [Acinetobacter terrestris]|uniref:sodium/glutamate symporter n=1 Tax=Acinetobacter terrestris TaxID=2529843 RepID=UPI003D9C845F
MLMFFTSVGLSADFLKLKEGGKSLLIFLVCVILLCSRTKCGWYEFSHSAWT